MTSDTFYLQNRIQLEANNLQRNHVYYSIDEQPEICARLIAESYLTKFFPRKWSKANQEVEGLGIKMGRAVAKGFLEGFTRGAKISKEEIYGHHVSVTVQGWEDVPAAIGLIRERQREFKKGMR